MTVASTLIPVYDLALLLQGVDDDLVQSIIVDTYQWHFFFALLIRQFRLRTEKSKEYVRAFVN